MSLSLVVNNSGRLGASITALAGSRAAALTLQVDNTPRDERREALIGLVHSKSAELHMTARRWARKIKPGRNSINFSWKRNRCRVRHADHEGEWTVLLEFLDAEGEPELFVSWVTTLGHPLFCRPLVCYPEDAPAWLKAGALPDE